MKRISRFLLLSIFLASCADAATPIQTPALTATKEATATFTPTNTPIPTPTPRPEGAPIDADAYFDTTDQTWKKKVTNEFGEEVMATWVPISEHGEVFAGWYIPHGEFPLIPKGQHIVQGGYDYPSDEIIIDFSVKEGMSGPNIRINRSTVDPVSRSGTTADNILCNSNPGADILGILTKNQTLLMPFTSNDGKPFTYNINKPIVVREVGAEALNDRFLRVGHKETRYIFITGNDKNQLVVFLYAPDGGLAHVSEGSMLSAFTIPFAGMGYGGDFRMGKDHRFVDGSMLNSDIGIIYTRAGIMTRAGIKYMEIERPAQAGTATPTPQP